jgi:hypothetical protein
VPLGSWACVFCLAVCGSAFAAPQLTGPSYVPEHLGNAVGHRALPMAWIRLAMNFGANDGPDKNANSTVIELAVQTDKGERLISGTTLASAAELRTATKGGRLVFADVPTELPILIRISVRSSAGAVLCTYARAYMLHAPDERRMAQVGRGRVMDESGYLGDFVVDEAAAEISRRVGMPYLQTGG